MFVKNKIILFLLPFFLFIFSSGCATQKKATKKIPVQQKKSSSPHVENHYIIGKGDVIDVSFFRQAGEPEEYRLHVNDQLKIDFPYPIDQQKEYRLHVNDTIIVDFTYHPELITTIIVPPDGEIFMKKVGKVNIINLTVNELTQKLKQAYSLVLAQPELVVTLTGFYSTLRDYPNLSVSVTIPPSGEISLKRIGTIKIVNLTVSELATKLEKTYKKVLHHELHPVVTLTSFYSPINEFFKVLKTSTLGQVRYATVRSDGMISLPVVGDMKAEGLSPLELTKNIQKKYNDKISGLSISVSLKTEASKRILVLGEVKSAGVYPLTNTETPIEAIVLAGGFKNSALLEEILVIRKAGNEKKAGFYRVNIKNELMEDKNHNNFYLKPYDIVFVPKTTLATVSDTMKQVYGLLPPNLNAGFFIPLNYFNTDN